MTRTKTVRPVPCHIPPGLHCKVDTGEWESWPQVFESLPPPGSSSTSSLRGFPRLLLWSWRWGWWWGWFYKFVICFNCISLLQSVVKLKRPNIYSPEDKKSVSQLYAKINSDVWSDKQLIENLRRAWRSSSQLGFRPSQRCSRPHVSGWSPSLGKSWTIKTSGP